MGFIMGFPYQLENQLHLNLIKELKVLKSKVIIQLR